MGNVDWVVVLRGRRALLAKLGKCDGDARLCYCGRESEQDRVRVSEGSEEGRDARRPLQLMTCGLYLIMLGTELAHDP